MSSSRQTLSASFRAITNYVYPATPLAQEASHDLRMCIRKAWFAQDGVEPESRMIDYILLLVDHEKCLGDIVKELVDLNALSEAQAMELTLEMHRVMLTLIQCAGERETSISGISETDEKPPEPLEDDNEYHNRAPQTSYFHKLSSKTNHSALQCVIDTESNGHGDRVYSVCFSADSVFLYTGSRDRLIKKFRLLRPNEASGTYDYSVVYEGLLSGHTNTVTVLASSNDSKRLLSGSMDYSVRLWDTLQMRCLRKFAGHTHFVYSVACSPDDSYAYSSGKDATIIVWSLLISPPVKASLPATTTPFKTLKGHSDRIRSIVLSPDGKMLFSGSDDKTICVWDLFAYSCIRTMTGYSGMISSLAVSASGHHLFSTSIHEIKVWDLRSYRHIHSIKGHSDIILSMTTTPLGAHPHLYSASKDRLVKVWDLHHRRALHSLNEELNPKCVNTVKKHFDSVSCLCLSPDGLLLATASFDKTTKVFSVVELHTREHRQIDKKRLEKLDRERFQHEERIRMQRLEELYKQSKDKIRTYNLTLAHIFDGGTSSVSSGAGDIEALEKLLFEFPELNCSAVLWEAEQMTPLMKACKYGMTALFNTIIWKADVVKTINRQDAEGETALHHASRGGHLDIVRHLLDHGAKGAIANLKNQLPIDVCTNEDVKSLLSGLKHQLFGGALVSEATTQSPKKSWFKNSSYVYHNGTLFHDTSSSLLESVESLAISPGSPRVPKEISSSLQQQARQATMTEVDYWLDDIGLSEYKSYFRDEMGASKLVRLRQFADKSPKELAEEFPKLKKFSVLELHRQLQRLTDLRVAGYKCRKLDADKADKERGEKS